MRVSPILLAAVLVLGLAGCPTDDDDTVPVDDDDFGDDDDATTDDDDAADDDDATGDDDDSGGDDDDAGDDDDTVPAPSCQDWCDAMDAACPDYDLAPAEACLTYCQSDLSTMTPGTVEDTSGDTLGCRYTHALAAAEAATDEDRRAACAAAHASGGGVCGTYCEVYCNAGNALCTSANPDTGDWTPFLDGDTCAATCAGYSTDVLDGVPVVDQEFGYGDTVQCRLHHLQAAAIEGAATPEVYDLHCGHASAASTADTCSDDARPNTVNYCAFVTQYCDLFTTNTIGVCQATLLPLIDFVPGYANGDFATFADTDVNTLGCLNYWAMRSAREAETTCPLADWDPANWQPTGAGACVAP